MAFYANRALGRFGLGVMGAFGGGAPELFPGGPAFMGGDDQGIFFGGNTGWIAGAQNQGYNWIPASDALAATVSASWSNIQNSINANDQAFLATMTARLKTLLNSFYIAVGNHSSMGYSPDATKQVVSIGNQLKAAMNQIATYQTGPQTAPVTQLPLPTANPVIPNPVTYPSTTSGSGYTVVGTSGSTGGQVPGVAPADDNTMLYVGLGVAGLVVVGGLLYLRKRKSVAGYRRRRR